jgi:retron-type reverse transcriptase
MMLWTRSWWGSGPKKVSWLLDADIEELFDTVNQQRLTRFVEHRVSDKRIHRQIQKWLKTAFWTRRLSRDGWRRGDRGSGR